MSRNLEPRGRWAVPGHLSRGTLLGDIDSRGENYAIGEITTTRKANLNKARLRDKEVELKAKLSAMLGGVDPVHVRFRHARRREDILVNTNPPNFQKIPDRGDFSFASIDLPSGGICIGVARCSPQDQFNRVYGRVKALKRLIELLTVGPEESRWGLVIAPTHKPMTGWTVGAVMALRLKQHYLDREISGSDFEAAKALVAPFIRLKKPDEPQPGLVDPASLPADVPAAPPGA